jgi:hypothetical protein
MTFKPAVLSLGLVATLVMPAFAQKATPEQMGGLADSEQMGTLHLKCNLGSLKLLPKSPIGLAEGRFEIDFSGTVLVNGLKGDLQASSGLVKEFDDMGRQIYHGTGKIVLKGGWRGLQWFGSDMTAVWYGNGIARLIGEFDKDLNTGEYWFEDIEAKGLWSSHMSEVQVPEERLGVRPGVKPTKRGEGGN